MKERPIIFSTDLIPKILDGTKTQTRRVISPQPRLYENYMNSGELAMGISTGRKSSMVLPDIEDAKKMLLSYCPYGQVGDRLWVRETWIPAHLRDGTPKHYYKADYPGILAERVDLRGQWRPSIFMPRWASRITLEITNLRVERLQEIGLRGIEAEGIYTYDDPWKAKGLSISQCRMRFARLWDSLNAGRITRQTDMGSITGEGYSWESNPWVWVIEFRRVK